MRGLVTEAANANDKALEAAEYTICNAASVGSVKRRYDNPDEVETWRRLCQNPSAFTPEPASNEPED